MIELLEEWSDKFANFNEVVERLHKYKLYN